VNSSGEAGRSPKLEGIDYKQAAIDYPSKLSAERLHHLRTKPFYNLANKLPKFRGEGMDIETQRHFCDFANMAVTLDLPAGARILDAGCGSGWLSEYFARLGYDVTGIDITPDLIEISRDRIRALPPTIDPETPIRCRFLVHDLELGALDEKFDAVVCYDAMHHLEDARSAIGNLAAMLPLGGVLFILEGNRPAPDSAGQAELIDVMRKFGTLESPFDRGYLGELLDAAGFALVGDYVSVNGLFDREALDENGRLRVEIPPINYLLCKKVSEDGPASNVPDSRRPGVLRAEISANSGPGQVAPGEPFAVEVVVRNAGDTLWLGGPLLRRGGVMLGVKIFDQRGELCDEFHGEPALPRALGPNESCTVTIEHAAPREAGRYQVKIDLVNQYICWFEERGSKPLTLPLTVG
jgi:2-polyprenyl-3-methyl-5-hydroxy-6-metoxy-1,4-benzoquinol methylase